MNPAACIPIPTAAGLMARRAAFTMIESVLAALIVAVMLTAAMAVSGAAGLAQYKLAERATAGALADAMAAEILAQAYIDPGASPLFGLETGETAGVRSGYDDVDDYNGLNETAPASRDGTAIPGLINWERTVAVNYAALPTPDSVSATDSGLKRIIITIKHNSATVLTRRTLRGSAR